MAWRRGQDEVPVPDPFNVGTVALAAAQARCTTAIIGQVTRMRSNPTSGQPQLEIRVSDDSGDALVVWSGRRAIGGVTLGRRLRIDGVARREGKLLVFANPAYTLC